MDLNDALKHILPEGEYDDLSLILDGSNLHTRIVNGAIMLSGPLDFIVKNGEEVGLSEIIDVSIDFEFALKNFSITSYIRAEADGDDMADLCYSLIQKLILTPWNDSFKDGKPLSDFEPRLAMASGILADTTAEFDGFYVGFLIAG